MTKPDTYITHLTLSTGHIARTKLSDVDPAVLQRMRQWLDAAILVQRMTPLPDPLGKYQARAIVQDGALVVTLYAHLVGETWLPLVTFGVAHRSRHSTQLWASLTNAFATARARRCPAPPWIAVEIHDHLVRHMDVAEWAGDFERCCAWAWITREHG